MCLGTITDPKPEAAIEEAAGWRQKNDGEKDEKKTPGVNYPKELYVSPEKEADACLIASEDPSDLVLMQETAIVGLYQFTKAVLVRNKTVVEPCK